MSAANTWYYGSAINVSSITGYYDSWYKTALYFSVLEDTSTTYKIRLYASVYFNEWTGWSSSSLTVDGTSKVSNSNSIYPSGATGLAVNGPWTKDITITKTSSTQTKSYSASSFCGGSGWSTVSISVSVPAIVAPSYYYITYDANGGSGAPSSQSAIQGYAITISSTRPTRDGYKFIGWGLYPYATASDLLYQPGTSYIGTSSVVFYAVWEVEATPILSVSNVTLTSSGAACTVTWSPASISLKYKLSFKVGSHTWNANNGNYILPNRIGTYQFSDNSFTYSLANYITTSSNTTATCYLDTYTSSGTKIGATQTRTFNVSVPVSSEVFRPVISSVTFSEGTASGFNRITKSLSTLQTVVQATGVYGSTIKDVNVNILNTQYSTTKSGNTYTAISQKLSKSGTIPVTITVRDSRGVTTVDNTRTVYVYNYYKPYGSIDINISGTTVTVRVKAYVASVDSQNTKTLSIVRTKVSTGATSTFSRTNAQLTSYTIDESWQQTLSDSQTATYTYKVTVTDKKGNKYVETRTTAITTISRLRGGKGVRLFGEATDEGFWVSNIDYTISEAEYLELARLLAKIYSVDVAYEVGDFIDYGGLIYECNTACSAAAWSTNSSKFTPLGVA